MIEIKAPEPITKCSDKVRIFLGGSIEQGTAEKWQERLVKKYNSFDVVFLNPRRDDWDSTLPQDPTPGTEFHRQVTWEMYAQSVADILVYYFDGSTKSPITLLELGAYGSMTDTIVYCPTDFWRYGNVKIFCSAHGIKIYEQLDDFYNALEHLIKLKDN